MGCQCEFPCLLSWFDNGNTFTIKCFTNPRTICLRLIAFTAGLFPVIDTDKLALSVQLEANQIISSWNHIPLAVNNFIVNVSQVFSICCDCMIFLDKTNTCWLTCCRNLISSNFLARFITSNCFQGTWLIGNFPFKIKFISICTFLVSPPIAGLFFIKRLKTERFSIQEQFNTCSVWIGTNWNLTFCVSYFGC